MRRADSRRSITSVMPRSLVSIQSECICRISIACTAGLSLVSIEADQVVLQALVEGQEAGDAERQVAAQVPDLAGIGQGDGLERGVVADQRPELDRATGIQLLQRPAELARHAARLDQGEQRVDRAGKRQGHAGAVATLLEGLDGKAAASMDDLKRVAPLALRHRLRRNPLDDSGSTARIERAVAEVFAA